MSAFQIDAYDFEWIGGAQDDPEDRCLHGRVRVQFGDTVVEDVGTVSATALYLLKTLREDKVMASYDIQMVPCCGHSLIANGDLSGVTISGCNKGADWTTLHEGDDVRFILPSGQEARVSLAAYREAVLRFADKVEAFYKACTPKKIPENEFDRDGYTAFWNEWRRRYDEAAREIS